MSVTIFFSFYITCISFFQSLPQFITRLITFGYLPEISDLETVSADELEKGIKIYQKNHNLTESGELGCRRVVNTRFIANN